MIGDQLGWLEGRDYENTGLTARRTWFKCWLWCGSNVSIMVFSNSRSLAPGFWLGLTSKAPHFSRARPRSTCYSAELGRSAEPLMLDRAKSPNPKHGHLKPHNLLTLIQAENNTCLAMRWSDSELLVMLHTELQLVKKQLSNS